MTSFATLADVRALLGGSALEEPQSAQVFLDLATASIRAWTNQTISLVTNDQITMYGNTERVLVLPERPVVSVSSVQLNGVPLAASAYMLVRDELWWGAAPLNIANITEDLGRGWGTRATPIQVTYTHGFDPIPDAIRSICVFSAFRAMQQPIPVAAESIGDYSVSYGRLAEGGIEFTGTEQKILKRYRRTWQ